MAIYDRQTSIKLTSEELRAWKAAARSVDMPLQAWIRLVCDHASGQGLLHSHIARAAEAQRSAHAESMRRAKRSRSEVAKPAGGGRAG